MPGVNEQQGAESRRTAAIGLISAALTESGCSRPAATAVAIVDAITDHAVETYRALVRAEEKLKR